MRTPDHDLGHVLEFGVAKHLGRQIVPDQSRGLGAECFRELDLGISQDMAVSDRLGDVRAFEVVCP